MVTTVKNAKLKPGYKLTEMGVIPEDWDIFEIGNIIDYTKGFAFKSDDYQSDGVRIIRVSDTTFDSIKDANQIYINSDKAYLYHKWALKEYDLIISTVGSKPPIYDSMVGKVIIIGKQYKGALLNQNAVLFRSKQGKIHKQILLLNHFRMKRYLEYIESIFRGNANQASITLNDLFHFQLALPRKDVEQQAIATALSDIDALITSLDQLIAKKRDIKQATMQQLLTGKTRLSGFSGKWEMKRLGEIGKPYGGLSGKSKEDFANGQYPYIPFLNIMNNPVIDINCFDYVNINSGESQSKAMKGDLFFNGSSETPEEVGMCSVLSEDVPDLYLNSFCFGFRLNNELGTNGLYLAYYFRSGVGRQLFYSLAQGATRYNLSKRNFLKMEIPYPELDEQTAIATVLSDMDAEIVTLEQKREKTRALKQGMMQELLTGKIRLV